MKSELLNSIYPVSRSVVGRDRWDPAAAAAGAPAGPDTLFAALRADAGGGLPGYLHDLLRIEHALWLLRKRAADVPASVAELSVNLTVSVSKVPWSGLSGLFEPTRGPAAIPVEGRERVLLWYDPRSGNARIRPAGNDDLLALKMAAEGIPAEAVAAEGGVTVGAVEGVIERAVRQGLLLAPPSKLRRDPSVFTARRPGDEEFLSSDSFTLQWHITQVCDLHCKHCYDRSDRSPLSLGQAVSVLDDLHAFCRDRRVRGAVSFTGGNPLLHPQFNEDLPGRCGPGVQHRHPRHSPPPRPAQQSQT